MRDDMIEEQVTFKIPLPFLLDIHWAVSHGLLVLDSQQTTENRFAHAQRRRLIECMDIINDAVRYTTPRVIR